MAATVLLREIGSGSFFPFDRAARVGRAVDLGERSECFFVAVFGEPDSFNRPPPPRSGCPSLAMAFLQRRAGHGLGAAVIAVLFHGKDKLVAAMRGDGGHAYCALLVVAGSGLGAGRAGRGGAVAGGVRRGGVQPVPAGDADAVQPDSGGPEVESLP